MKNKLKQIIAVIILLNIMPLGVMFLGWNDEASHLTYYIQGWGINLCIISGFILGVICSGAILWLKVINNQANGGNK